MLDPATLRSLIREVIAEEVAAVKAAAKSGPAAPAPIAAPAEHGARIVGDADLAAFARQVLALAADPARRKAIEAGTYPFRLQAAPPATGARPAAAPASVRVSEGVVTETMIGRLAKGTTRLEVAPGVAITPLARDAARRLNIAIERARS
jgi:hypothetical protein